MRAVWTLSREGLRSHLAPSLALTILVATGFGAALTSLEIAERTERAYPDFVDRARVAELVVNPSLPTDEVEGIIRDDPAVVGVTSDALLTATADDGRPRPRSETASSFLQVRSSNDGRYVTQDRPVVTDGRMIRSGREAFVSLEASQDLGVRVGDELPLAFWAAGRDEPGPPDTTPIEPLGRTRVTVVGVGLFPDEALADGLYPRQKVLVTPDVGAPYDCELKTPRADDPRSVDEIAPEVIPGDCSMSYRLYSLHVAGGDRAAGAVARRLANRLQAATGRLPAAFQQADIGYTVIPSFRSDDLEKERQSLVPVVGALRVFGVAAGVLTAVMGILLGWRLTRRREMSQLIWRSLGMSRRDRTVAIFGPVASGATVGAAAALAGAWLASDIGPIAGARAIVPMAERGVSGVTLVAALVATFAVLVGLAVGAFSSAAPRPAQPSGIRVGRRPVPRLGSHPAVTVGLRAASASRGSTTLLVISVLAVTTVTATLVFGSGLARLISDPQRFGWPYDVAVVVNGGYRGADLEAVADSLHRPEVESWDIASVAGGLTIDGVTVPFVAPRSDGPLTEDTTTISGHLPRSAEEIALGELTARRLSVGLGDRVDVSLPFGRTEAKVSGIVILPSVGPLESDRASLGTGALLSAELYEAMLGQATAQTGQSGSELADSLATFVTIDLAHGVDSGAFLRSIRPQLAGWAPSGTDPVSFSRAVTPATIENVDSMRGVPAGLAGVLAFAMTVGLAVGIAASTRYRRRELGVLAAIGAPARLVRSSVRVHALAVACVGLAVGIPLGIAGGRAGFGAFARSLGVAPDSGVPFAQLAMLVVFSLVLGLSAASVATRRVARLDWTA